MFKAISVLSFPVSPLPAFISIKRCTPTHMLLLTVSICTRILEVSPYIRPERNLTNGLLNKAVKSNRLQKNQSARSVYKSDEYNQMPKGAAQ